MTDGNDNIEEKATNGGVSFPVPTPKPTPKPKAKPVKYKESDYQIKEKITDSFGEIKEVTRLAPEYRTKHLSKCKLRAAKFFDVSIKHLSESYRDLNGKKIDGFYVNEMIDRFGFSNGRQLSRAQLSAKYKYEDNIHPLEVAVSKLKAILSNNNVNKAYSNYIKDIKDELNKDINDKATFGE